MKTSARLYGASVICVCALCGTAFADGSSTIFKKFEWSSDTNSEFVAWGGPSNSNGYQVFSTENFGLSTSLQNDLNIDFAVKGGHIVSHSGTAGSEGTVSTLVDTTFHTMVSYDGFERFQPFVTLDMNLPTGRATLYGSEKNAIMDRDLVPQTRFGEGWNFNPGVGVTVPFSSDWVGSLAVGYNFRSSYTPDGDYLSDYDPGDQLVATAGLTYLSGPWLLSGNLTYTNEAESNLEGIPYFDPGDAYSGTTQLAYRWAPAHTTRLSAAINYTAKNKITDFFSGGYVDEEKNSNSTLYTISVSHTYNLSEALSLTGTLGALLRNNNSYEANSDFFVPAKTKYSAAIDANYSFNDSMSGTVGVGAFTLNQDATPYLDSQHYIGFTGHAYLKINF